MPLSHNTSDAPFLPSKLRISYIKFAMENEAVPVMPRNGGELLPAAVDVPSVRAYPRSPTAEVEWAVLQVPRLECFKQNLEGKAKFTKVSSRVNTVL